MAPAGTTTLTTDGRGVKGANHWSHITFVCYSLQKQRADSLSALEEVLVEW
jgi:hypothetical protein